MSAVISLRAARARKRFAPEVGALAADLLVSLLELQSTSQLERFAACTQSGIPGRRARRLLGELGYLGRVREHCAHCGAAITAGQRVGVDLRAGLVFCSAPCSRRELRKEGA